MEVKVSKNICVRYFLYTTCLLLFFSVTIVQSASINSADSVAQEKRQNYVEQTVSIAQHGINQKQILTPYLLSVSFYTKIFQDVDNAWLTIVNDTPYDGIAVMMKWPYNHNSNIESHMVKKTINNIILRSNKDIWPWVFFNQFIGGKETGIHARKNMRNIDWKYFERIPGMDIYDQTGALSDFKHVFRTALQLAKKSGSPGIIIDPEPYNNRKTNDLKYIAELMKKPESEIKKQLNKVGGDLAKIVKDEFPNAILLFLLIEPESSISYIAEGILQGSIKNGIPLNIIEGGEVSVGYINKTVKELENKIQEQKKSFMDWKEKYPTSFAFGGTISPTDDPKLRKSFIKDGYEKTNINSVEDLKPFFRTLFSNYDYVWIYAASATQFNPFDSKLSNNYHEVIRESLKLERNIKLH